MQKIIVTTVCVNTQTVLYLHETYGKIQLKMSKYESCVVMHMMSNEFEAALDLFLAGKDADEAHQALYDVIRAAFLAGWRSAGGDPPQEQKLFELIPGGKPLEPPK